MRATKEKQKLSEIKIKYSEEEVKQQLIWNTERQIKRERCGGGGKY